MNRPGEKQKAECEMFLEELEGLPKVVQGHGTDGVGLVSAEGQRHAQECGNCRQALADFSATRHALNGLRSAVGEDNPWFAAKVMAAIGAREREIEERREGVWVSVRRLAPRLVAVCAILLLIGSTWAMKLRRTDQAQRTQLRPVEALFEPGPSLQSNDDVMASAAGTRP